MLMEVRNTERNFPTYLFIVSPPLPDFCQHGRSPNWRDRMSVGSSAQAKSQVTKSARQTLFVVI